jgi:glycine cleavage system H protein
MSQVPADLRYRDSHEWIRSSDSPSPVGITDHAQAELTDVVFVELPTVGTKVSAGDQVAVVESVKAASDIYAPVSGEIAEVNEALSDDPSLVNTAPYEGGWIFKLAVADATEVESLMTPEAYEKHLA